MRFSPIIGDKVWFGPKSWGGWGWQPVSWEGWASMLGLAVPTTIGGATVGGAAGAGITCGGVALVMVVCVLKGTSPGGAEAKAAFDRHRRGFPGGPRQQRLLREATPDEPSVREAAERLRSRNDHRDDA